MTNEKINKIIGELVVELKSRYSDFRGIYLFGSYARGEAGDDSDIDLAIVFDREIDWRFKDEIRNIVNEFDSRFDILTDSLILSVNELIKPKEFILDIIMKEGVNYG